jgi:hypothetical protein
MSSSPSVNTLIDLPLPKNQLGNMKKLKKKQRRKIQYTNTIWLMPGPDKI